MVELNNQSLIGIIGGILAIILLLTSFLFNTVTSLDEADILGKHHKNVTTQTYEGPLPKSTRFSQNLYKNH